MVATEVRPSPTRERLLFMYDRMTLIREFEERLKRLVDTGLPIGAAHYYSGEEAVAVGTCAALAPNDWISSTHRGHGHCIAKGVDVRPMMAELYGKVTGTNRGKGGSMHITDISVGMIGVNPILGMGTTHAIGSGLSAKVLKNGRVTASFYGEGASSIGAVHESLNLAAIWKLPIVFVCENNRYAQSTPVEYAIAIENIADRAQGYGMPGVVVDGQDCLAVYEVAQVAVQRARRGDGPTLIECKTYRYHGHASSDDPRRYRTAEEEQYYRDRDCIKRFREQVTGRGLLTAAELDQIDARNSALIDEAIKFAEESPLPDLSELTTDVYVPER